MTIYILLKDKINTLLYDMQNFEVTSMIHATYQTIEKTYKIHTKDLSFAIRASSYELQNYNVSNFLTPLYLSLTWTLLHNNLLINNNDELTRDKL